MTAREQTAALFLGIAGVLAIASIVGYALHRRFEANGPNPTIHNLNSRIKAWWVMVALIAVAFALGNLGVVLLFAFASPAASASGAPKMTVHKSGIGTSSPFGITRFRFSTQTGTSSTSGRARAR